MLENLDDCVFMTGRCMIEMQASRRYIPCRRVYTDFIFSPLNGNKDMRIQRRMVVVVVGKLKRTNEERKRGKKIKIQQKNILPLSSPDWFLLYRET
jgi:hypothetical protein